VNRRVALVFVLKNGVDFGCAQVRVQIELGFFEDERGRRRSRDEKTKRAEEQKSFAVHGWKQTGEGGDCQYCVEPDGVVAGVITRQTAAAGGDTRRYKIN
jgi:hypothetical protein